MKEEKKKESLEVRVEKWNDMNSFIVGICASEWGEDWLRQINNLNETAARIVPNIQCNQSNARLIV